MKNALLIAVAFCALLLGQTLINVKQLDLSFDGFSFMLVGSTLYVNTANIPTINRVAQAQDTTCVVVSGSSSAYVGGTRGNALTAYADGMRIIAEIDVTSSGGAITLDCGAGAKPVYQNDGVSAPTPAQWSAGAQKFLVYSGSLNAGAGAWRILL
jgi:hypothetical protein